MTARRQMRQSQLKRDKMAILQMHQETPRLLKSTSQKLTVIELAMLMTTLILLSRVRTLNLM